MENHSCIWGIKGLSDFKLNMNWKRIYANMDIAT